MPVSRPLPGPGRPTSRLRLRDIRAGDLPVIDTDLVSPALRGRPSALADLLRWSLTDSHVGIATWRGLVPELERVVGLPPDSTESSDPAIVVVRAGSAKVAIVDGHPMSAGRLAALLGASRAWVAIRCQQLGVSARGGVSAEVARGMMGW